jgi:hypothetical protein
MLALEEFGKLLEQGQRTILLCGFELTSRLYDDGQQIYLTAAVMVNRAQIADSIMEAIREGQIVEGAGLDTFLRLDEASGTIYLDYLGPMVAETPVHYIQMLQEFIWIANEWRYRLDLKGKEDLVPLPLPIRF